MAKKKVKVVRKREFSEEAKLMDRLFRQATKKAAEEAFKVRKTIMVEKDGWLVMVNKDGKVTKRVKRIPKLVVPAA